MAGGFRHLDATHPYASVFSWFTGIRWILYLICAASFWCVIFPILVLQYCLRQLAALLGWKLLDRLCKCREESHLLVSYNEPPHVYSNTASSPPSTSSPPSPSYVGSARVRFQRVTPSDRMWLLPPDPSLSTGGGLGAQFPNEHLMTPGTHPAQIIHAVLTFTRRGLDLAQLTNRFAKSILAPRPDRAFERFKWKAVKRTIRRQILPSWCGGVEEEYFWMEELFDGEESLKINRGSFDLRNHIRAIPYSTWNEAGNELKDLSMPANAKQAVQQYMRGASRAPLASSKNDLQFPDQSTSTLANSYEKQLQSAQLQSFLSYLSTVPLRPNQPLWELLLLEPATFTSAPSGPSANDDDEEECYVIFRCSHAVADGVLLSGIILKTFLQQEGEELTAGSPLAVSLSPSPSPASSAASNNNHASLQHRTSQKRMEEKQPLLNVQDEQQLGVNNETVSNELQHITIHLDNNSSTAVSGSHSVSSPALTNSSSPSATSPIPAAVASPINSPAPARIPRLSACARIMQYVWMLLQFIWKGPYLLLHLSLQSDSINPLIVSSAHLNLSSNHRWVPYKEISWSERGIPLTLVKQLSKALKCTLNDLVMNVWVEVLQEYCAGVEQFETKRLIKAKRNREGTSNGVGPSSHTPASASESDTQSHKHISLSDRLKVPESMFVLVPFNVRSSREMDFALPPPSSKNYLQVKLRQLGNIFAVLMLPVPMGDTLRAEGPCDTPEHSTCTPFLRRLNYWKSYMSELKEASAFEPTLMYAIVHMLLQFLPTGLSTYFLQLYAAVCAVVITNNRSPEKLLILPLDPNLQQRVHHSDMIAEEESKEHGALTEEPTTSSSAPNVSCCKLKYWVSWAPQLNSVGPCVTILTYHGQLRVSIVTDPRCVRYSSCNHLVQRYQEKLEQLAKELL